MDLGNKYKMSLLNLPNKLTLGRIIIIPVILILIQIKTEISCLVAALLFFLAATTDIFDGYIARRVNQVTILGKFLDPLADKLLVCSVLIMMVELQWVSPWVAILIISRDIMVTGLRAIAADSGHVISADNYGKIKTVVQYFALFPLILNYSWFGINMHDIGTYILYAALILTLISGVNYFYSFFKLSYSKV